MSYIEQIFTSIDECLDNIDYINAISYIEDIYNYIDKSKDIEELKYIDKLARKYAYATVPTTAIYTEQVGYIIHALKNISILIRNKIKVIKKEQYYEVITKLIYNERRLDYIRKILMDIDYDNYIKHIFEELLNNYVELTNEEDIMYYSNVIMLFLEYDKDKLLTSNKSKYIKHLKEYLPKKHIKTLVSYLEDSYKLDLEYLVRKYNVNITTSPSAKKEHFTTPYYNTKRVDYTHLPTISIDTPGSECLDDAISLVKNRDGSYYLYVFITDIPSIIPFSSYTFKEAIEKMETRYLITGPIEMFPKYLSYDICSLNKCTKRYAISHRYLIDPNFNVDLSSLLIEECYISVNSNLDYKQADRIIRAGSRKHSSMLNNLLEVSLILKKGSKSKEEYRRLENKFNKSINSASRYLDSYISPNIVQELMVLVNYTKPLYMQMHGIPYLYRNNIDFDMELLTRELQDSLEKLKVYSKSDYNKILAVIQQKYMHCFFSRECLGHKGLDCDAYAWTSSPGRRAPDSINQYIEHQTLFGEKLMDKTIYELEEFVDETATYFNGLAVRNDNFNQEYNYLVKKKKLVGSERK